MDPADEHIALEYAFLSFESGKKAVARRILDRPKRCLELTSQWPCGSFATNQKNDWIELTESYEHLAQSGKSL